MKAELNEKMTFEKYAFLLFKRRIKVCMVIITFKLGRILGSIESIEQK